MNAVRRDVLLNRFSHQGVKYSIMTGCLYEIGSRVDPVLRGCIGMKYAFFAKFS